MFGNQFLRFLIANHTPLLLILNVWIYSLVDMVDTEATAVDMVVATEAMGEEAMADTDEEATCK